MKSMVTHPRSRGFILLIVIAILGILALMGLGLMTRARDADHLALDTLTRVNSRLLARSGIEHAVRVLLEDPLKTPTPLYRTRQLGPGTRRDGGNLYGVTARDSNGCLHLNDGLAAGRLELGAGYDASAIDPIILTETTFYSAPSCWGPAGQNYVLLSGAGHLAGTVPAQAQLSLNDNQHAILNDQAVGPDLKLVIDHTFAADESSAALILSQEVEIDASAWINLRLRHLLNAYGDAHKFRAELGHPTWRRDDMTAGFPGNYLTPFTGTSTVTGDLTKPMHAFASNGAILTDPEDIQNLSTGLGDRILAARPGLGYSRVDQVAGIVDAWGREFLPETYVGRDGFFERVHLDFTVNALDDDQFSRMVREPVERWFASPDNPTARFKPHYFDTAPPDLKDIFQRHPHSPVNVSATSQEILTAVFYACANVGLTVEGERAFTHNALFVKSPQNNYMRHLAHAQRSLGIAGPVLREPYRENGLDNGAPNRLVSLRDAWALCQGIEFWAESHGPLQMSDDLREALAWFVDNGVNLEKAEPLGVTYSSAPIDGGFFTQDYLYRILPHVLSSVRRVPGWLGAPQPLLSPIATLDGVSIDKPETGTEQNLNSRELDMLLENAGAYGTRSAEDFVFRSIHPKIDFFTRGSFDIVSQGVVSSDGTANPTRHRIRTGFRDALLATTVRTQQALASAKDLLTSPLTRTGPEPQSSPDYPSEHLGSIGLNDRAEPVPSPLPLVFLEFNQTLSQPVGCFFQSDPASDPCVWERSSGIQATDGLQAFESGIDNGSAPFFAARDDATNLSPFNGLSLSSFHNGFVSEDNSRFYRFRDALYWRPYSFQGHAGFIAPGDPVGHSARNGLIHLWFRIPSGQSSTSMVAAEQKFTRTDSTFKTLFHLHLWDRPLPRSGGAQNVVTSIVAGLRFDKNDGRFKIRAHYENTVVPDSPYNANMLNGESPPLPPPAAFDDTLPNAHNTLLIPFPSSYPSHMVTYDAYRALPTTSRYVTRELTLRDIPECGPGTWHRISVGWNVGHGIQPLRDNFWLLLLDKSNLEPGSESSGFYHDTPYPYDHDSSSMPYEPIIPGHGAYQDRNMVLSLGESHVALPDDHASWAWQDGTMPNIDSTNRHIAPGWRLDSCIDDFQFWLKDIPLGFVSPDDTGYLSNALASRYQTSSQPSFKLKATKVVPKHSKLLAMAVRAYEPQDENANYPDVATFMSNGSMYVLPQGEPGPPPASGLASTSRVTFFNGKAVQDIHKFEIMYLNVNPQGNSLSNSSLDNFCEIPWIKELTIYVRPPTPPKFINWNER